MTRLQAIMFYILAACLVSLSLTFIGLHATHYLIANGQRIGATN